MKCIQKLTHNTKLLLNIFVLKIRKNIHLNFCKNIIFYCKILCYSVSNNFCKIYALVVPIINCKVNSYFITSTVLKNDKQTHDVRIIFLLILIKFIVLGFVS